MFRGVWPGAVRHLLAGGMVGDLLLQSYKIIFISPNFAWLKLAKIHQGTALELLKNIKFAMTHTMPVHCAITYRRVSRKLRGGVLRCYGVTVVGKSIPIPKFLFIFIYIIIYINISITFDFCAIFFGTVTLQHCNTSCAILPNCTFYWMSVYVKNGLSYVLHPLILANSLTTWEL